MELHQLSSQYTDSAELIKERIIELKKKIKTNNCEPGDQLYTRVNLLTSQYYELMKTAHYLAGYYDICNRKTVRI